jgi:hypothetical protein
VSVSLRSYTATDEEAAIELWRRTWQAHYPQIDFSARLSWWRARWRGELVPSATIVIAESASAILGFVTVDPITRYIDQIVVAPEAWGSDAELDYSLGSDRAEWLRISSATGTGMAFRQCRPCEPRPNVGDRELSHGSVGRAGAALREVRAYPARL